VRAQVVASASKPLGRQSIVSSIVAAIFWFRSLVTETVLTAWRRARVTRILLLLLDDSIVRGLIVFVTSESPLRATYGVRTGLGHAGSVQLGLYERDLLCRSWRQARCNARAAAQALRRHFTGS
jgi:hypothetical protein